MGWRRAHTGPGAVAYPFTRSMAGQLPAHDDRVDFLAGVDLILGGLGGLRTDRTDLAWPLRGLLPSGAPAGGNSYAFIEHICIKKNFIV